MSDISISSTSLPSKPASKPAPLRITPRIRAALMAMVWDGLTDNQAARKAGMTVVAIRLALKQPHIRAFYREQLDVLRQSESAANIHALRQVRNQKSNQMARVAAVKAMEQINEAQGVGPSTQSARPGVVVQILMQAPTDTRLTQPAELNAEMRVIST